MIYIKDLNYKIQNFELNIPYLEFKKNEMNLIIGPSGSGKTTLFRLITGEIQHPNWQFMFDDINVAKLPISEKKLGVVFQTFELFPHLTAEENVKIVMKSRNCLNQKTLELLALNVEKLKLTKCWKTQAEKLSGGEKQRVSLLRAIMSQPRLLLLDEPFSALDEETKVESKLLLQTFLSEIKMTTIMITHDVQDQRLFSQNCIRFMNGKVEKS